MQIEEIKAKQSFGGRIKKEIKDMKELAKRYNTVVTCNLNGYDSVVHEWTDVEQEMNKYLYYIHNKKEQ